jgi:hypothetical protein
MTEETEVVEKEVANAATDSAKSEEKDKEYNFSQVRKQLKERDDYILNLKKEVESLRNEFTQSKSPKEEDPDLDDDDFITKKHLKKYASQIAQESIRNEFSQYEQKNFRQRAKEKYSDFDDVVNAANLQRLEADMPEIAKMVSDSANGDNYKMATNAYKAIKTLLKENTEAKEIKKNKEAIERNTSEPLAAAAVDRRPIAKASRLSDADYQELWKEMQHYASKA